MEGSRNTWWERFEWWYLCHQPFSRICQSIRKLTFALMVIPSAWLSWVFTKLYSQRMNCKSFDLIDIWSMYVCIRLYEHQSSFQPKMPLFVDAESKGFIMLIIFMLWHPCLWLRSNYGHSLATACELTHLENIRAMELDQVSTTKTPRRRDFPVETPEKAPRRIWSFGSYVDGSVQSLFLRRPRYPKAGACSGRCVSRLQKTLVDHNCANDRPTSKHWRDI